MLCRDGLHGCRQAADRSANAPGFAMPGPTCVYSLQMDLIGGASHQRNPVLPGQIPKHPHELGGLRKVTNIVACRRPIGQLPL
jgi:hypothetical protein